MKKMTCSAAAFFHGQAPEYEYQVHAFQNAISAARPLIKYCKNSPNYVIIVLQ